LSAKVEWVDIAPKKNYFAPMNQFKNLLIAILTGLLALSLFTQPAQSAVKPVKTYDAVKLIEYEACLAQTKEGKSDNGLHYKLSNLAMADVLVSCSFLKPN
jgi:hypothetical protein